MVAIAGFRIVLWARIAALFRKAAAYFENKSDQSVTLSSCVGQNDVGAGDSMTPVRFKGAPAHWLAMVRERAPGFLSRVELSSYSALPVNNTKREPEPNDVAADYGPMPTVDRDNASASEIGSKRPLKHVQSRTQEKSARMEFVSGLGHNNITSRLRFKTLDNDQPIVGVQQAHSLGPAVQTTDKGEVKIRTTLGFKSEYQTIKFKTLHQTVNETPIGTKFEQFSAAVVADKKKVVPEPDRVTDKPSKMRVASMEEASQKIGRNQHSAHRDQQSVTFRSSLSDNRTIPSDRKYSGQATGLQNRLKTKIRPMHRQHSATCGDSMPADSFWPALSGLEKTVPNRERWPELPADAWSELSPNRVEAAPTIPGQSDASSSTTEDIWNG